MLVLGTLSSLHRHLSKLNAFSTHFWLPSFTVAAFQYEASTFSVSVVLTAYRIRIGSTLCSSLCHTNSKKRKLLDDASKQNRIVVKSNGFSADFYYYLASVKRNYFYYKISACKRLSDHKYWMVEFGFRHLIEKSERSDLVLGRKIFGDQRHIEFITFSRRRMIFVFVLPRTSQRFSAMGRSDKAKVTELDRYSFEMYTYSAVAFVVFNEFGWYHRN